MRGTLFGKSPMRGHLFLAKSDPRGAPNFRHFPKEGGKILDFPEGWDRGGGRIFLDLIDFFSMFLKHIFSCFFFGIWGTFDFFGLGVQRISDASRGGGEIF